jgi:dGTPase
LQPVTLEGNVVKIADGVAYLNHDLDDAIRAGIIEGADIPREVIAGLGGRHSERINTLVADIIAHSNVSYAPGLVTMSEGVRATADVLRNFLFERVYDPINARPETIEAQNIVRTHYNYFMEHPGEMPSQYVVASDDDSVERHVADFVASMTDRFATELYQRLHAPSVLAP